MLDAEVRAQISSQLASLLPPVQIDSLDSEAVVAGARFDLVARVSVGDAERTLLVEISNSGQPRHLREAIARFEEAGIADADGQLLIAAPYISPRGMDICRRHGVGCVDLVGNGYLAFDGVYIERVTGEKPASRRRRTKDLFAPVSSRALRAMLEEPERVWRLAELAETAGVSLGQTYNVSEKLVDEDLARKSRRDGLALTDPGALLDIWREAYDVTAANEVLSFHTSERDPGRFMVQVGEAARSLGQRYAFTLHAGGSLVAPFVRFNDVHFYVGPDVSSWVEALGLRVVEFGGNIHLLQAYDDGVFYRLRKPRGLAVVGNVQIYLDLYQYPARGREQAEHLREHEIGF